MRNRKTLRFIAPIMAAGAMCAAAQPAEKPNFPAVLPGSGLAQHDFFYAGEAKSQDMYIVRMGKVVWEFHDRTARGEISDAVLLSSGNVLFAHQFGVTLIDPEKKVLWRYDAPPGAELQIAKRMPNGNTIVNTWFNEWDGPVDPATAPVQALEVTPDKKIVWALRAWGNPVALGPSTTIQLLDEPAVPEAVHFGDLK